MTVCSTAISELLIIAKSQRQKANWGFLESGKEMGIESNHSVDVLLTSQGEVVSREHILVNMFIEGIFSATGLNTENG